MPIPPKPVIDPYNPPASDPTVPGAPGVPATPGWGYGGPPIEGTNARSDPWAGHTRILARPDATKMNPLKRSLWAYLQWMMKNRQGGSGGMGMIDRLGTPAGGGMSIQPYPYPPAQQVRQPIPSGNEQFTAPTERGQFPNTNDGTFFELLKKAATAGGGGMSASPGSGFSGGSPNVPNPNFRI